MTPVMVVTVHADAGRKALTPLVVVIRVELAPITTMPGVCRDLGPLAARISTTSGARASGARAGGGADG